MGMPINSYSILNILANGGEQFEVEAVRRALEHFRCFAFILHDPEKDKDFHKFLSREFDRLDYITGDKLLFFALVDPPEEWLRHGRKRPYYQKLDYFSKQMLNANNYPKTSDPSISAYTLAKTMGIPYRDLPCVVVTTDFNGPFYFWVHTDQQRLSKQLEKLGYEAERQRYSGYNFEKIETGLASALAPILSVMVSGDDYQFHNAEKQAKNTIQELYQIFESLKVSPEYEEEYLENGEELALFLALSNKSEFQKIDHVRRNLLPISKNYIEADSEIMLRTGIRVINLLNETDPENQQSNFPQQDYSPGIISLTKFFEREINLSIVHFLRDFREIRLPVYFEKYQPDFKGDKYIRHANLNKNKKGIWEAPTLGQSREAFEDTYEKDFIPPEWTLKECETLQEHWQKIYDKRNPAAHTKLSNHESLNIVINELNGLNSANYFEKLYRLKCTYRGIA
ncbi:MAG: hypothetical protein JXI43_13045 [Tissierellales bacterium]|nr:hypothetical protein [Tissierellales bacterium]